MLFEQKYLTEKRMFYCPGAESEGAITVDNWQAPNWGITYSGYCSWAAHRSIYDSANNLEKIVADRAEQTSTRLLASDVVVISRAASRPDQYVWSNHLRAFRLEGGNFLYNDGSVVWKHISDIKPLFTITGNNIDFVEFYQ